MQNHILCNEFTHLLEQNAKLPKKASSGPTILRVELRRQVSTRWEISKMSHQSKELSYRLRVVVYHPLFFELSMPDRYECVNALGSARKVSDLPNRWRELLRAVERSPIDSSGTKI